MPILIALLKKQKHTKYTTTVRKLWKSPIHQFQLLKKLARMKIYILCIHKFCKCLLFSTLCVYVCLFVCMTIIAICIQFNILNMYACSIDAINNLAIKKRVNCLKCSTHTFCLYIWFQHRTSKINYQQQCQCQQQLNSKLNLKNVERTLKNSK